MATQLQIRRGTTAQMNAFTGAEGELAVNTTTDTVHVHDGSTAGGFALAKADGSNIATYAGSFTTLAASGAVTLSSTLIVSSNVGIGNSSPSSYFSNARNLVVGGTTGANGITISGSTDTQIFFADGTSGADAYRGIIRYSHADNGFSFWTNATRSLDIDSAGSVGIGTSSPSSYNSAGDDLVIASAGAGLTIASATNNSGHILFADSTSGTGAYAGFIRYDHTTDSMRFAAGSGSERMRIDSAGNVGIGQAPSAFSNWKILEIKGGTAGAMLNFENSSSTRVSSLAYDDGSDSLRIQNFLANPITFETSNTERMRIDSAGNLLVGCTGIPTGGSSTGFSISDNGGYQMVTHGVAGTTNTYVNIYKNANGTVGGIRVSGSQTFFDGSSDQRLKSNIVDAPSASEDIDAIQVRSFNWKVDNEYQKYGMIAQELATVAPIAVYQPEDPEEMQAVDYSKLIPMMLKEIQSLRTRVQELENN